jgi:hypothetical protein
MLSDPIVKAVMEADRVDPQELAAMLTEIGRKSRVIRSKASPTSPIGEVELWISACG